MRVFRRFHNAVLRSSLFTSNALATPKNTPYGGCAKESIDATVPTLANSRRG
jgi:hypothetical protein